MARIILPPELNALTKTQLLKSIDEAALSKHDTEIAIRRLVEKCDLMDIAAEQRYDRSTVSKRLLKIIPRVVEIAEKLYN